MIPDQLQNTFLVSEINNYSYNDLYRFSSSFKQVVGATTDPVGILTDNKDLAILHIASAWITGTTFVPFSHASTEKELAKQFDLTGIGTLFSDIKIAETLNVNQIRVIDINRVSPDKYPLIPQQKDENDIFAILFTSGSSGAPKAVPLRRRQMISAAGSSSANLPLKAGEYWLHCLPVHHIGGVSIILRTLIYGSGIFNMSGFDTFNVAKQLSDNTGIKAVSLVPTQLKRLLELPDFAPHDDFRSALIGGGTASAALQISASNRIPSIFSYGMTETCAQIVATEPGTTFTSPGNAVTKSPKPRPADPVPESTTRNPYSKRDKEPGQESTQEHKSLRAQDLNYSNHDQELKNMAAQPACSGRIFPGNYISIRDSAGNELAAGESGIVCLKGPQVFEGYLPPAENTFSEDGWFITGDYGRIDEQGFLFIESRREDRIVTGGENVDPAEVESALMLLPGIKDVAVIALPDQNWGEIVTAIIVQNTDGHHTLNSIRTSLKKYLSAHKLPRRLVIADKLPKTDLGKVIKKDLVSRLSD